MINYVPWERITKNYEFIEGAQMSNSIIVFQLIHLDIFYETFSLLQLITAVDDAENA